MVRLLSTKLVSLSINLVDGVCSIFCLSLDQVNLGKGKALLETHLSVRLSPSTAIWLWEVRRAEVALVQTGVRVAQIGHDQVKFVLVIELSWTSESNEIMSSCWESWCRESRVW
ncbi:hypothetical protein BpHYR1_046950 [Brachionus plicatilis]|uniref:Uncharacterized protein n=1 Tax=Brachionus plicatilis TaxID=10195 RepID=A0A3M7PIS0_BRAPC|nr:hypothetical protein BpHYR1_046950 [Brachionus plicatilis]